MTRWYSIAVCLFLLYVLPGVVRAADSSAIVYGINWYTPLNQSVDNLFCDSLGFNTFHFGSDSVTMAKVKGNIIYAYGDSILKYSGAERMLYSALQKPDNPETLTTYYFFGHRRGDAYPPLSSPKTHWEISDSSDTTDVVVMDSNEYAGSWKADSPGPLKIAVGLTVLNKAYGADTSKCILSVILKEYTTSHTVVVVDTLNVRWGDITDTIHDVAFFSPSVSLSYPILKSTGRSDSSGLILEVHSKRFTTVRIAWVCVEDQAAHDLRAGIDLDMAFASISRHIDSCIILEGNNLKSKTGNRLLYAYLADEPALSQLAAMARVNADLNYGGITEVQGYTPQLRRYIAQVKPKVLWYGGFGAGGLRKAFADEGLMDVAKYPDSVEALSHGGHVNPQYTSDVVARDVPVACVGPSIYYYPLDTVRNYKGILYGYFGTSGIDSANTKGYDEYDYGLRGALDVSGLGAHLWEAAQDALVNKPDTSVQGW